jgi:FKBP-type peptidyl-prolyl cis-trans isomerase SlyD
MQIGPNKVVSVTYLLKSSLPGAEPVFVEETGDENPLIFLFGSGQLIPEFERNLAGLIVGKDFAFNIDAENAYGNMDDEALVKVSTEMFKVDGAIDLEVLRIGNMVPLLDRDGNQLVAKIVSVEGDDVMLDFNHPLAGQNLHFAGKVVNVREATSEEMAHGHAHDGMAEH